VEGDSNERDKNGWFFTNDTSADLKYLETIRLFCVWAVALALAALPVVVAADFGGILRWTQFVAAIAVTLLTLLSLLAYWDTSNRGQLRQHVLLLPIVAWIIYGFGQTLSLPPAIVKTLNPASYEAYTLWLQSVVPESEIPSAFPISISPHDSAHVVAMLCVVVAFVFASAMIFCTRSRITLLLNVLSLGAALHVVYALLRLVFPDAGWIDQSHGLSSNSFGIFVNRNNAALLMNLGLACSLGLLSWRVTALSGQEIDDGQFEYRELFSLLSDRDSIVGIVCTVLCLCGLLLCGSRGGIVSILAGALLAFGWVRQRRGFATLPVVVVAVCFAAGILLVPLQLSFKSLERFDFFSAESSTIANDGRLLLWPECFQAALANLPTGSGLSTFAYAYLPNQSGTLKVWANHADNLWLELFLEQGFVGLALVGLVFFFIIRAINRLAGSPDPIDQGLRTAGWYMVGAIVCSQCFDFGLILPGNLFFAAIVFTAIIARTVSVIGFEAETDQLSNSKLVGTEPAIRTPAATSIFAPRWRTPIFVLIALCVIGLPVAAMGKLKNDAEIDTLIRKIDFQSKSLRTDLDGLRKWEDRLELRLRDQTSPALLAALGDIKYSRARLAEVIAQRPKTLDEIDVLFGKMKPAERTHDNVKISSDVMEKYREAMACYDKSLAVKPLGIRARSGKLYLSFLESDPGKVRTVIDQLIALHRNNPSVLLILGEYAANRAEFDLATELWKTATQEQSRLTARVISLCQKHDQISLADVVPPVPATVRLAAERLLKFDDNDATKYLAFSLDALACDQCDSLEERSSCLSLQGDVAYKLEKYDLAFEQYALAIQSNPAKAELRLKLVRRLREQDRIDQARAEAIRGRSVLPNDNRFDRLIKSMAEYDLRHELE
jgi:O-antigen ligase/tetratricopeptide (TPR) repeat protein